MHDGSGRIMVQGLSKSFGPINAVQNLSFAVRPGAVTGFLGPNGSGKTTTLRMILGLVTPSAGTATINGQPFHQLANPARVVGAVLEAQSFHPTRTARNHLRCYAAAMNLPDEQADRVLELVGLTSAAQRKAGTFSLGMRQRLALARALVRDPALLVLDEATSHLDVATEQRVDEVLSRLSCTRVVIAHRLSTVMNADLIAVLKDGRVVETGTHVDLMARRGHYAALVNGQVHLRGAAGSRTVRLSGRLR